MWRLNSALPAGALASPTRLVGTFEGHEAVPSPQARLTFYPRCSDRNDRLSVREGCSLTIIAERPVLTGVQIKHLKRLEAESIGIMREVVAEFRNPVMLYSIGKDSTVMVHLARKAFFPPRPPFPLLHIDTGWKFREMIAFRDATACRLGLDLLVHANEEGRARGINPISSGSVLHTAVMKTEALKQALDRYAFDAAFGGARRDEERSRAKERIFSLRSAEHGWNPRNQRPELWRTFNTRLRH